MFSNVLINKPASLEMFYSCISYYYYMGSSVSGQDQPNPALWLATRAGKMELSCLLGITRCVPQEKFPRSRSQIINPLLTKLVRSRWLDIGQGLFCMFMDLDFVSVHKHAKKEWTETKSRSINTQKRTWPISSHLDRTSLVNNPYLENSPKKIRALIG